MFHFLPPQYEKKVRNEYNIRALTIVFLGLSFVSLVSLVLTLPIYFAAANRYEIAISDRQTSSESAKARKDTDIAKSVTQINSYVSALSRFAPLEADTIVQAIISARPRGVSINSLSVGATDQGVKVSVSGIAETRNDLLSFSRALGGVLLFSNVDLPVSYLAKDANISYSINLSLKPK